MLSLSVQAQNLSLVKGLVVDEKDEPLIGVNVKIVGTNIGAITNIDGTFTLNNVPSTSILEFSYIGMQTKEEKLQNRDFLKVKLMPDSKLLDDVVVVGYTTQKKQSLTGSMQSIKSDKLKDITAPNVENMLNGKAPGVYVAPGSGRPGSKGAVVIRGQATLSGNTQPLWVIDGVIVGADSGLLNPEDIESISILKDAASTAIYGSQGANGVVVVTTKGAKAGKMTTNVNVKVGASVLSNGNLKMMTGQQLYDLYNSFPDKQKLAWLTPELAKRNFNWWNLASTVGITQDYSVNLRGGNDQISSFFSIGYYKEKGAVKGFGFDSYSARGKMSFTPYSFITIKPSFSSSLRTSIDRQYSVNAMYSMFPWDSPFLNGKDGELVPNKYSGYEDPRSTVAEGVGGRLPVYGSEMVRKYTNQKLLINKSWDLHHIDALLAYEWNDYYFQNIDASGVGFLSGFTVLDVTAKPEKLKGQKLEWAVQSFFANAKYSYDYKYFVEAMVRRDGASSLYPQYNLYSASVKYNEENGLLISQIGNPNLTWEQTLALGLGVDASFLDDRLYFTLDLYKKKTNNILYQTPITGMVGVTSIWNNIGKMDNSGVEFSIGASIIKTQDFTWNVDFNIGSNKNKLIDIYKQKDKDGNMVAKPVIVGDGLGIAGSINKILEIGYPIDTYYDKKWAGVNVENGSPQWYKSGENGEEVTSDYSQATDYKLTTQAPKAFGGFSTSLNYKNIYLSANFGYSIGGHIYNYSRTEYDSDGTYTDRNQMALQKGWKRWMKPGDIATHPIAKANNQDKGNAASSRYIESNDYLKLRSLSLNYNLPFKKFGLKSLQIGVSAENVFTITKYSGVDPELPASDGLVMGTTSPSVYPSVRRFMFSLNATF